MAAEATPLDPDALRARLAATLPAYLVPSAFVEIDAIPLNANGKLDRRALPVPPDTAAGTGRAPRTPREAQLCALFAEALAVPEVSADDDFFALGGHSLLGTRLIARVRAELGARASVRTLFEASTPAAFAERLDAAPTEGADTDALAPLLPLRNTSASGTPLFCLHHVDGIGWCYAVLGPHLDEDTPLYAVQAAGLDGAEELPGSIGEMAQRYVELIREAWPSGPYRLLGCSMGGLLAHEVAVRLREAGQTVEAVILLDTHLPHIDHEGVEPTEQELRDHVPIPEDGPVLLTQELRADLVRVGAHIRRVSLRHVPRVFDGDVVLFHALRPSAPGEPLLDPADWRPHVTGRIDVHDVDVAHLDLLLGRSAETIGRTVAALLRTDNDRKGN